MTSRNTGQQLESLHTVFVIVYLQEIAWLFTPLIISLNVLIHTFISPSDSVSRWASLVVFLFFFITGIVIIGSLFIAHKKGLKKQQMCFLWPYLFIKIVRMVIILTVSLVILIISDLRKTYLHVAVYCLIEFLSSAVAIEIVFRSSKILRRIRQRALLRGENESSAELPKTLNGAPSISHTESTTLFARI
uniref:G_PROTEIN_RECEP_F1_2 domain-containing protein n=1 Tax=Steinernema glaseri TaxID=37863 RepID=A0A1I8A2V8_9BILA